MDAFLILVATAAFICGVGLGLAPAWTVGETVLVVLVYLGLRYPQGRSDWKYSPVETIYMLSTLVTMLVFIYIIYLSATALRLPWDNQLAIGVAVLAFMVMFLLGLFYPSGGRLPVRGKK